MVVPTIRGRGPVFRVDSSTSGPPVGFSLTSSSRRDRVVVIACSAIFCSPWTGNSGVEGRSLVALRPGDIPLSATCPLQRCSLGCLEMALIAAYHLWHSVLLRCLWQWAREWRGRGIGTVYSTSLSDPLRPGAKTFQRGKAGYSFQNRLFYQIHILYQVGVHAPGSFSFSFFPRPNNNRTVLYFYGQLVQARGCCARRSIYMDPLYYRLDVVQAEADAFTPQGHAGASSAKRYNVCTEYQVSFHIRAYPYLPRIYISSLIHLATGHRVLRSVQMLHIRGNVDLPQIRDSRNEACYGRTLLQSR